MNEGLIPRRYAKALYKVSEDRGDSPAIYNLMTGLTKSFESCPDLQRAIANPFVSEADKRALIFTAVGLGVPSQSDGDQGQKAPATLPTPAEATFADFIRLLGRNRRIDMLRSIAGAFCELYRQQRHIRKVTLVTAATPDDNTLQRLIDLIKSHIGDDSMELVKLTDPSLIGGFTVDIDNKRLDASVDSELKRLRLGLIKHN